MSFGDPLHTVRIAPCSVGVVVKSWRYVIKLLTDLCGLFQSTALGVWFAHADIRTPQRGGSTSEASLKLCVSPIDRSPLHLGPEGRCNNSGLRSAHRDDTNPR